MKGTSTHVPLLLLLALVVLFWVPVVAARAPEGRAYVVRAGDWLSKISEKEYDNLLAYPRIVDATNAKAAEEGSFSVIGNPDVIRVGQKLWLPTASEGSGGAHPPAKMSTGRETTEKEFEDFDPKNFDRSTNINNAWFPLKPGTQFVYTGTSLENGKRVPHHIVFTVTDLTKVINGVRAIVIADKDYREDQMIESELTFFAQDNDGNVWHLGQYRETYDDTEFVGGRVWLVGTLDGARAGIMMKAKPQLRTPSYSEGYAPPPFNWTDRGRVYQTGQKTRVPVGSYGDVLVIEEFNREEPEAIQLKYYARGVGNVRIGWRGSDANQETLELVKLVHLGPEALAKVRADALELEKRAYTYGRTTPAEPTESR